MYSVDFFGHKVTKLIVGDNPFNGHSYITDYVTREEMLEYHTEDRILEAMHKMEELGVNTMLPLADPYIIRILQHYRRGRGRLYHRVQRLQCDQHPRSRKDQRDRDQVLAG